MLLSASSGPEVRMFFGMSVGTAVAVISYISRIFSPIESIGMEIQTIQEALAGAKRVGEFLELPTRLETSGEAGEKVMTGAWQSRRRHGFAGRMHFSGRRQLRL